MRKIILIVYLVSFSFCKDIYVVSIHDGDTLRIMLDGKEEKLRLYGIDTPELKQEYGKEAKEELQKMCKNKKAKVELKGIDRYKRHLGVLYCDERNVNKALLQNGYAWSYNNWNKKLEIKARREKQGLWKEDNPINPKEYRRK